MDSSTNHHCQVNAEDGTVIGKLVHGDAAKLSGNTCDEEGRIWNDSGKQIGQAEPLPESERQSLDGKPFEDFQGAIVERSGDVTFEGRVVGKLVEGDKKQYASSDLAGSLHADHYADVKVSRLMLMVMSPTRTATPLVVPSASRMRQRRKRKLLWRSTTRFSLVTRSTRQAPS